MAIFEDKDKLADLCRRWHVTKLSLFGSRLKGLERPDSDLDLLVEFEKGQTLGYMGLAQMEIELSELLGSVKVDLCTAGELTRYFRRKVVRIYYVNQRGRYSKAA